MKNASTMQNPIKINKLTLATFILTIILIIVGLLLTFTSYAQVTFTQTSDADFLAGYQTDVVISGNNVNLRTQGTSVNNWLSTTDLPQALSGHQVVQRNSYIYLTGGFNGTDFSNSVYRATFQSIANGGWTAYDTLPVRLRDHGMVAGMDYLYVMGGRTDGFPSDKIYFSKINSDGTLGAWAESAVSLPQALWGFEVAFHNGYIYVCGGTNLDTDNSAVNDVYYSKIINIDGELSAFTATSSLPDARNGHEMLVYGDDLIVTGGYDNTGTIQNTVYYASLNLDGTSGSWVNATALTTAISNHSSTCYNGVISIIGGENTLGLSDEVYYADINELPSLTWTLSPDLLYEARKDGVAYAKEGQVIFAGGENISTLPIHNTRYATVALGTERVNSGTFISLPFTQLGEERDIESLTYNITYNTTFNNYDLNYRLAASDGIWGNWIEMNQDNPAVIGQHMQYLQYMVKFDGTDDNVVLHDMTINISGYTQLSGNLNAIDTLKLVASPYWATGNISFTGGTHVVEAGVEMYFSPNTGLEIGQANMNFEGTAAMPITLTSYSAEAGLWNGVYFNTNSDNTVSSVLDYVIIEKAGAGSWNANLYCVSTNEPQINNCLFSLAEGHGIRLNDADISIDETEISLNSESGIYNQNSSPSLSNTNILSNTFAGIYFTDLTSAPNFFNCTLDANYFGIWYPSPNFSFPPITGISSYNNIVGGIAMAGGDITADQTWPYNPLGYAVLGDVRIIKKDSHVRLTIEPGNTIYCDSLVHFEVGTYIYYANDYGGEINAVGTADSLITFTSINGETGGWDGIFFHYNSDSFGSESELKNCVINNARNYNIRIQQSLQPRIDSCIITNAGLYDIYVEDPNSVPHITSSTSTVYINSGTQTIDKTWYNFGGEYIILNDIIVGKKDAKPRLTIQPGITVKADTNAILQIATYIYYANEYGGELFAEGNADSLITFTSRNGEVGGWDGIYFHYNSDSFGAESSLKYCTIEKGKDFNVKSDGSAEPRIDQCTISNSNGMDIYATAPNSVQHITNTNSTVYVGGGTQSINKTWYNFGGDYIILTDYIIGKKNDTVRLTIEPGNTIFIDTSAMIQVGQYLHYANEYGGEIYAEGNADSLIIFTSRNGEIGGWDGIYFHYNSDSFGSNSSFSYCTIENGSTYNIKCENTIEPRIDNCSIINAGTYDIHAANPNSVPHVTNTNSTLFVSSGTQSINRTWYNFGGEYVVLGDIIVGKKNAFCTLTIQPGNTVRVDTNAIIQIGNYIHYQNNYGGEIIAEGTYDSLIVFQPRDLITGHWDGINFHYNADNFGGLSSFKYCMLEGALNYNIYCDETNNLKFDHVTITNSGFSGIRLNSSSPYLKLCQVINNDSIGIFLTGSSNPVIGDTLGFGCDIFGSDFGIYNATSNLIHAKNNFWNTMDSTTIAGQVFDLYDNGSYGIVEFMDPVPISYFDNQAPEEFNLFSLADNTVTTNQSPSFTWEVPIDPNGDDLTYYFYYTDDESWSTNVSVSEELTNPEYTIQETLTGGKWYWWKVKVTDGILSNYSIQEWTFAVSLPPVTPTPIVPANGSQLRDDDYLVWLTTTDPDDGDYVSHYRLQLDDDPNFLSPEVDTNGILVDSKASSLSMLINTLPGHENLENKNYYWRISATDGFGVESDFSDGSNYFLYMLDLQFKVMLEGPFMYGSMSNNLNTHSLIPLFQPYNTAPWNYNEITGVPEIPSLDVIDWILIELRSTVGDATTATPDKVIFRMAAFVLNDGKIASPDGTPITELAVSFDDNTYLVIYHRNHLEIMTAEPLTPNQGFYNIDLTTDETQVYGGASGYSELMPGVWGMASGDANADGSINMIDKNTNWTLQAGTTGYVQEDFNMDGQVNNPDKNDKWETNEGKMSQIPD